MRQIFLIAVIYTVARLFDQFCTSSHKSSQWAAVLAIVAIIFLALIGWLTLGAGLP